jgi:hypothetical protein
MRQGSLLAEGSATVLRQKADASTLEEAFLHFAGKGSGVDRR